MVDLLDESRHLILHGMKMILSYYNLNSVVRGLIVLVFIPISVQAFSQCDTLSIQQRNQEALSMLTELYEEGLLAVRLKGYEAQIRELDRLLGAEGISETTYERLLAKKMSYLEKRKATFEVISAAFRSSYSFSDVVFYYSEDQEDIGNPNALMWLDSSGEILKDADVHHRIVAVLQEGSTSNLSLEAFLLRKPDLRPFCEPIPAYFRLNRFSTLLAFGDEGRAKKAEKMVEDLNSTLKGLLENLRQ